jgi:hypothetical protein
MATAGFSFEDDIAPLRGENFGGKTAFGMAKDRAAERDTELRIAQIQEAARSRDIAFQQQQMALERQAEEARRQREAYERIPEITMEVTSILEDPERDDTAKAADLARLQMNNARLVQASPAIQNLFTTAEKTHAAKQKEQDRINALAFTLMQSGQADAVKKVFEGSSSPLAVPYIQAAQAVADARRTEQESAGLAAESKYQREQEEKLRVEEVGYLGTYLSTLRRMAPEAVDEFGDVGTLKGKEGTPTATTARPFNFTTEDRVELEEMMRDLNPMYEDADISRKVISDENLYRDVLRSTKSKMRRLRGSDSGFARGKFTRSKSE